jgi:hypothetical protein
MKLTVKSTKELLQVLDETKETSSKTENAPTCLLALKIINELTLISMGKSLFISSL